MMAKGATAPAPASANGVTLTKAQLREIAEYDRLVQFRDAVFAGTHSRVKIPPHLLPGKQVNSALNVPPPSSAAPRANAAIQVAQSTPGSTRDDPPSLHNKPPNNQRSTGGTHVAVTGNAEINPVLLEKSDDLIKAEIQLKRQRLERDLREQIEQQRIATKALLQTSESLPDFDLSEVLSKALAIVHPDTATEPNPSVGARSTAASDSFDENTFYSSQHDTPEPSSSSQGQKEPVEMQSRPVPSIDEHAAQSSTRKQAEDQDVVMTGASLSKNNHLAKNSPPHFQKSNLDNQHSHKEASNSDSSNSRKTLTETIPTIESNRNPARQESHSVVPPAVVRAHNLSPFAPQPARVSPLATSRNPPILQEPITIDEAPSAQVNALRSEPPGGVSSTASSPKGLTRSERRKEKREKKKKRKAKEPAGSPDSPYIKAEPRSPSPYAVASRPQKRQRQSGQFDAELNYDEPRFAPEQTNLELRPEQYTETQQTQTPRSYHRVEERYDERYGPEIRQPEPIYRRVEKEDSDYRRVSGGQYVRGPLSPMIGRLSPAILATPYGRPTEVRQIRAASHAVVDRRIEEPVYYREPIPRASVRPDADRERSRSPRRSPPLAMGPPRQPVRIVIDEYGRKYYDPGPAPSMRQSAAPLSRIREPEVFYERTPLRTVSSRAPAEVYEEGGVIYRTASPAMAVPRRVVTQPEYASPDYRSYRQREYSVRPTAAMLPPGDDPRYIEVKGPERRQMTHFEEVPREYVRAPSARPEPVRYEMPRVYSGRLQSIQPEQPPREYAASVRPEARREMIPQPRREFSVGPGDVAPHREHIPAANGGYYEQMPSRRPTEVVQEHPPAVEGGYYEQVPARRPAEVAFIERPRAREASVVAYADDMRREVYR